MKKIFIFLLIFFIIGLYSYKLDAKIIEDVKTLDLIPDNLLCFSEDEFVYEIDNIINLNIKNINYLIGSGSLNKIYKNDLAYYILVNNNTIYKIEKDNKKISKYEFKTYYFNDFLVNNEFIYLAGHINSNGVILKLDLNFTNEYSFLFNGEGNSDILNICINNKNIYLSVYKDGIINDDRFFNIGNKSDKKSLLLKLNLDLSFNDVYYFNHDFENEKIISITNQFDHIVLLLKCGENIFLYDFDDFFKVVNYFVIKNEESRNLLLIESKTINTYLFLSIQKDIIKVLDIFKEKEKEIYKILDVDSYYSHTINNGLLHIYYKANNYLYCNSIKEYTVTDNNDLVFNRLYYSDNINHIKVSSYFDNITFFNESINIEKMIDGTYLDKTKVLFSDGTSIDIYSNKKVEPYTNFIDNGIYKTGKVLEFFGYCYLNDELVYYGKTLNEEGNYKIKIVDYNNNVYNYNITIDDSFYKQEIITNIKSNINVNKGETPYVKFKLNNQNIFIKGLIINGTVSYDFNQNNDILTVYFSSRDIYGVESFCIEKIYYESNGIENSLLLNDLYTVCYLKEAPTIDFVKNINKDDFDLNFNIVDNNESFEYLKIKLLSNNEVINEQIITGSTNYNFIASPSSILKIYYIYNLSNSFDEYELASYSLDNFNYEGSIDLDYTGGKLNKINIKSKIPSDKTKVKKIMVLNSDIVSYYEQYNEYNIGKVISIITIIFVVFVVGLFFLIKLIKRIKSN